MKNSKYFPFVRNRYFYGKLLSVDDFELEQRYGNNKRRTLNRFLNGAGVVAGLSVVRIDEKTISIEEGIALDLTGREIIVDTPVIKRLELIDGFSSCMEGDKKDYVYLCIDYDEKEEGAVHSIAENKDLGSSGEEYGKIRESYQLSLTDAEPEYPILDKSSLYEQCSLVCRTEGISIKQYLSRYVTSGGNAILRIEVENTTKQYLSFSYDIWLDCLSYGGQSRFTISFNEAQHEKTGRYSMVYELASINLPKAKGSVTRAADSLHLFMDRMEISVSSGEDMAEVYISNEDVRNLIIKDYYQNAMEDIQRGSRINKLYIAKLYLLRAGETYIIDRVENVPFNQYVMNQNLSFALHQLAIEDRQSEIKPSFVTEDEKGKKGTGEDGKFLIAAGTYRLDLKGGGEKGKIYTGGEIEHGLGTGNAAIWLGIENEGNAVLWGQGGVFDDVYPSIGLAAKTYPDNGTFRIGGKLLEKTDLREINIRWTAIMDMKEKAAKKMVKKIFIKPGALELKVRESRYMEAVCTNMPDESLLWHVSENGGDIDENGMYTAPGTAGVYEVTAVSKAYPEVKASIYIMVREDL